ncbi:hypothetical protein Tco_0963917 [Tanacetum coccineum]
MFIIINKCTTGKCTSLDKDIAKRFNEDLHSEAYDNVVQKVKVSMKGKTHYGMKISDRMLNDDVKKSMAYKRYLEEIKNLYVPTTQPQQVESTQVTNKEPSVLVVRVRGKQLIRRGRVASDSSSMMYGHRRTSIRSFTTP